MSRPVIAFQGAVIALAAILAFVPLPPHLVEAHYADRFYPALQSRVTSWSNTTAFSLFDMLVLVVIACLLGLWVRSVRLARQQRSFPPVAGVMATTITVAAFTYVWFSLAWGLNYARPSLESTVAYDAARITPAAVRELAERAVAGANATVDDAHCVGFPARAEVPPALVLGLHAVERALGRSQATTPSRPKRTLLAPFFRSAGVDGMLAPFLLETLLNPDLTGPERPAVLAHEWAHLSGYAPESDASFVGLLAALRADAPSRYSAWLALFDAAASQLPAADQRALVEQLAPAVRRDRRLIVERLTARVDVVADASWQTYDRYLKLQGVEVGVQSYSRVVQLLLGSGALDWP